MKYTLEKSFLRIGLPVACLYLAASFAVSQSFALQGESRRGQSQTSPSGLGPTSGTNAPAAGDDYIIGPEDVLEIDVWKQTELSGRLPVRPDGKISMPLIGEVEAAGLTAPKLADVLTQKLKTYITKPQVNVMVQEVKSQFVNIVGEIAKPGRLQLTQPMTILDAIIESGGPTQFAKVKKIYVLRPLSNGVRQTLYFDYKAVIKGQKLEENIYLKRGDTLVIP